MKKSLFFITFKLGKRHLARHSPCDEANDAIACKIDNIKYHIYVSKRFTGELKAVAGSRGNQLIYCHPAKISFTKLNKFDVYLAEFS